MTEEKFLSTPSARRATVSVRGFEPSLYNFYPRPPRGGRLWMLNPLPACKRFLSTPSARRATKSLAWLLALVAYFYPRPPRGGRQELTACIVRRDLFLSTPSARRATAGLLVFHLQWQEFLSTPSARRATINFPRDTTLKQHFYPRPPRGGRPYSSSMSSSSTGISIHALREEGDAMSSGVLRGEELFLSTPSARRATAKTETKSLFSNKLYNILHEFRRALIYNGSKNYPNHAK